MDRVSIPGDSATGNTRGFAFVEMHDENGAAAADDTLNEIAHWTKKTRDETFVEKDANGHTVNRCEGISFIGGCTDTNEFNYLVVSRSGRPVRMTAASAS